MQPRDTCPEPPGRCRSFTRGVLPMSKLLHTTCQTVFIVLQGPAQNVGVQCVCVCVCVCVWACERVGTCALEEVSTGKSMSDSTHVSHTPEAIVCWNSLRRLFRKEWPRHTQTHTHTYLSFPICVYLKQQKYSLLGVVLLTVHWLTTLSWTHTHTYTYTNTHTHTLIYRSPYVCI